MIFLDTCIWIELLATKSPETQKEINQASLASNLLKEIYQKNEKLVTCKEQIVEVISAIQKVKMKEYNRNCNNTANVKVGSLKEFRESSMYYQTQDLCKQIYGDLKHMTQSHNSIMCAIEDLLDNIHLVDINDFIYYNYCCNNDIDFYTFDGDFNKLEAHSNIHILK